MKHYRNEKVIKLFGKRVRFLRQQKGLSMEKLAELVDMEYKQLSRIEKGEVNTSISRAVSLASALKIHSKELFDF